MANQLGSLGLIERTRGNTPEACTLWQRSLALFAQVGARPQVETVRRLLSEAGCPDQPDG